MMGQGFGAEVGKSVVTALIVIGIIILVIGICIGTLL